MTTLFIDKANKKATVISVIGRGFSARRNENEYDFSKFPETTDMIAEIEYLNKVHKPQETIYCEL